MAANSEHLPEGTDTIIPGASATGDEGPPAGTSFTPSTAEGGNAGPPAGTSFQANGSGGEGSSRGFAEQASELRGQATDKARNWASQGKEKAVGALDHVVNLVSDAAGTIDERVGEQYGAYARRAAETLSGYATTLRTKDVDELARDARDAVRKSPAIAIGAAAAIGFLLARAIKAASTPAPSAREAEDAASSTSKDRSAG